MVTDEMVKAAVKAVSDEIDWVEAIVGGVFDSAEQVMRAALEAALSAAEPVATKQIIEKFRVTGFRGNPLRVVLSNRSEATISQKLIDSFASPSPFKQHSDDVAVDRFATAMKAKLAEKRADGASGWDDPEVCHIDYLAHLLKEQIHSRATLDTVDIGNFAMMIFNRGETPSHGR
jgi:hypothetical protein